MTIFDVSFVFLCLLSRVYSFTIIHTARDESASRLSSQRSPVGSSSSETATITTKQSLLHLLEQTPRNAPTPALLTAEILDVVNQLEQQHCPTDPADEVLDKLAGTWTLQWTTQDRSRADKNRFSFINPLENQSYSNNPNGSGGRANPVLPMNIQNQLENVGVIPTTESATVTASSSPIKSTQTIDIKRQQVINVVSFVAWNQQRVSLTVRVDFTVDSQNARRIHVKFQSVRVVVANTPINIHVPLGLFGPTGWLQTDYIDETMRITRGHKGSVFILTK
jgi:hypothetical protein